MKNKVALEEHYATAETVGDSREYFHSARSGPRQSRA